MLASTNANLSRGIFGVLQLHQREHQYSRRGQWMVPCFPKWMNALDLTGLKSLHLPAKIGEEGSSHTRMSSLEKVNGHNSIDEKFQPSSLLSAYEAAMEALSSLITRPKRGIKTEISSKYTKLERMAMYVQILGLEEHMADLKIIHVAGTKGKGSTCTFCEAILRECGFRTGLFTSPHLIDVRERFRLDGSDISEEQFLLYFWDCWNLLKGKVTKDLPMPPLFQFLTLLAFKVFVSEKVDVAIIEVGLGGKTDSTNVIKEPVVCGITSLGMDHTEVLGDTLGQIASHKAGIFKPQVCAFTVPQLSEAMDVLQETAEIQKVPLKVATPLTFKKLNGVKLSLSGDHQLVNGGLAVSLCKSWLQTTGNWERLFQDESSIQKVTAEDNLPEAFLRGLSTARLSGRAQIVNDSALRSNDLLGVPGKPLGELIFYLDGAHSPESMEACARWFSNTVGEKNHLSSPSSLPGDEENVTENGFALHSQEKESKAVSKRILLFNCMETRDPEIILPRLLNICSSSGSPFSKAIFVPSVSKYNKVTSAASSVPLDTPAKDLSWQFNLQRIWEKAITGKDILPDKNVVFETADNLPTREFLYDNVSQCGPAHGNFGCSAVISSLPLAINWLRDCARDNPSIRFQVLVTGSLHLVGDVLKLLRR